MFLLSKLSNRWQLIILHSWLIQLDFVVRKITSTSAWRQVFINKAKKKNLKLRSLIAGYGIRWTIKFESRERVYEACEVRLNWV